MIPLFLKFFFVIIKKLEQMSYSNFSFSGSPNLDTYEPSPEFLNIKSHAEAPAWALQTYYWGTIIFSLVTIVTAIGQIYTRMACSHFTSSGSTNALIFTIFAWITLVVCVVIIIPMSIYALVAKVGFAGQISTVYRNITKGSQKSDEQFRMNELRQNMSKQQEQLVSRSNLQHQLDTERFTYPDLQL
jgi:hypothetical protein